MNRHLLLKTKAKPCRNFQVYSAELQNGLSGSSHTYTHVHKHQVHSHMHTCLTCTQACTHMKGALWTLVLTAAAKNSPTSIEMPS